MRRGQQPNFSLKPHRVSFLELIQGLLFVPCILKAIVIIVQVYSSFFHSLFKIAQAHVPKFF